MLHINIVSLITNFDKLIELLAAMKNMPDIICLSETNLKISILIQMLVVLVFIIGLT